MDDQSMSVKYGTTSPLHLTGADLIPSYLAPQFKFFTRAFSMDPIKYLLIRNFFDIF